VSVPRALAVDLALLTVALDDHEKDVGATLALLASDAAAAVLSYVGLSVRVRARDSYVELTTLGDDIEIDGIKASIRIPWESVASAARADDPRIVLVLYASTAGAFVDLAADLAWLTGRSMDDVLLDHDIGQRIHAHPTESLRSLSTVNQAVGVLIGQGRSLEEARDCLDAAAAVAGTSRQDAATGVLASLRAQTDAEAGDHLPSG